MREAKAHVQAKPAVEGVLARAWRHREPAMWVAIVLLAVTVRWPTLKGWYYSETGAAAPASGVTWTSDLAAALSEARSSHKRVLVDFSASWCPPCIAMKHEVWPDTEVVRAVGSSYVALAVDADHDNGLSARYQVEGIPAILILDADGRVIKRNDGYLPKAGMLSFLGADHGSGD